MCNDICILYVTGITHRNLNIENIILKLFKHKTMTFIEPNPHTVLLTLFKKSEFINVNVVLTEHYWILSQGFGAGFLFCVCLYCFQMLL